MGPDLLGYLHHLVLHSAGYHHPLSTPARSPDGQSVRVFCISQAACLCQAYEEKSYPMAVDISREVLALSSYLLYCLS